MSVDAPSRSDPGIPVLGVEFFAGRLETAAPAVVAAAAAHEGGYVCFGNVHVLVAAQHSEPLAAALSQALITFPDGAPVAWLERQLGGRRAERVGGPDLMPLVFDLGRAAGLRHYLYGSTPAVLDALERRLLIRFPGAEIVGTHSPPFGTPSREVEASAVQEIRAASPDLVWCGLGAPKQELWMARWAEALSPALLLGVGAAFDFHAGTKQRAPRWMREAGLEWAHRLSQEPGRLAWRYLTTNSEFIARAAVELTRRGRPA